MKKDIHPATSLIEARCICGKKYPMHSVKEDILVSFCSACHPFYTNTNQFADTEGRIEKFNKKYKKKS